MFKTAIVGCGGIGMAHGGSWRAIGAEIAAVVDVNPERAAMAAKEFNAKALSSIDDLPDDLNAVSVVTNSQAHYEIVSRLLPRFNVFCEKPLTLKIEEGEHLIALAKQYHRQLGVGFKMRFEPIFCKAKELLPQIGKLMQISSVKAQMYGAKPGFWIETSGALCELSIHELDLIGYIAGVYPEEVIYSRLFHRLNWPTEDGFSTVIRYSDNVTGMLQCNYCTRPPFDSRDICLTFVGEDGLLRIERPDRIVLRTDKQHVIAVDPPVRNAFEQELEHFRDAVLGKHENQLDAANANRMLALILAIRKAAEK